MAKQKPTIEFGELLNHTGYHIRRSHSTFMRLFAASGKKHLLKSQQSSILILSRENPEITPAAVADTIEIERSLMTRLLTDLKQQGFIETKTSKKDAREKGLFITQRGQKFIRKVMDNFRMNWNPS